MAQNRTAKHYEDRRLAIREQFWPGLDEDHLWSPQAKAFAQIPRSMPLILLLMDSLCSKRPVSRTYLYLWFQVHGDGYVAVSDIDQAARQSGFESARRRGQWSERMKMLKELGIIDFTEGLSHHYEHVLIWNPFLALRRLHKRFVTDATKAMYAELLKVSQSKGSLAAKYLDITRPLSSKLAEAPFRTSLRAAPAAKPGPQRKAK